MKEYKSSFYKELFYGICAILVLIFYFGCILNLLYKYNSNLLFVKLIKSIKIENLISFLLLVASIIAIYIVIRFMLFFGSSRGYISLVKKNKIKIFIVKFLVLILASLFPIICLNELQFSFFTNILAFYILIFSIFRNKK